MRFTFDINRYLKMTQDKWHIEIVILWVYYTIPFGFSLFRHFLVINFQLFILNVWLMITDEGSLPEMRIWSI